jgi:hypothetical protein
MEAVNMKKCCPNNKCARVFEELLNACEKHKKSALALKIKKKTLTKNSQNIENIIASYTVKIMS